MTEKSNDSQKTLWGDSELPDLNRIFHDCKGYAKTPGWALIHSSVLTTFKDIKNIKTIELGCGLGKVSLLFSILGAKTTLLDYSDNMLAGAKFIHSQFGTDSEAIKANLLELPETVTGTFDIAMSFGTAEHFWNQDRQRVFDSHAKALKSGGMAVVWVPNKNGVLFNFGRWARQIVLHRRFEIDETPFTHSEIRRYAENARFTEIQIKGAGSLIKEFNRFIVDVPRIFKKKNTDQMVFNVSAAKEHLQQQMTGNTKSIKFWNNLFSYPLLLIGKKP